MTETVATQLKAIAFERDIQRLTENFTGREWVFKEIDGWLQQENQRFFILTGEPGVGKSAIAARLTQIRDDVAAYHFCIAGRSGTIEPNNVLLSIAAQLIDYFPDYAEALANTIKPLKLSINVEITIETLKDSEVRGVVISNLHTQNPQEALNVVLRQALAALPKPPQESKIILIDSLDEAVTLGNRDNLVALLSGLHDLPSWVRLILTSRPEDRVLVEFKPLEPYSLEETSAESLADIRQYVEYRVEQPVVQAQLSEADVVPLVLIDRVVQLSSGNFLYTKLLLDEIEAKRQSLNDLSALPKSIDDIYLTFLRRFKHEEWKKQYQPILGTLTAALEPVTEDELENFTNITPRQLRQDLGIIRQFLDKAKNEVGKTTYAIFHQSLRDYLQDKERNQHFWCDAQEQHTLIINHYKKKSQTWQQLSQIDRYGLKHLAQHFVQAGRVKELHTLLALETAEKHNAWFEVKDRVGDIESFLADVELAWIQAEEEFEKNQDGNFIAMQCRYALIISSINSLAQNVPASLIIRLLETKIWSPSRCLALARQIPIAFNRMEALREIAIRLPELDREKVLHEALRTVLFIQEYERVEALNSFLPHLSKKLLSEALQMAQAIQDPYFCVLALAGLIPHFPEVLSEALNKAQSIQAGFYDDYRPVAMTALAPYQDICLTKALQLVQSIQDDSERQDALSILIPHLSVELLPQALKITKAIQKELYQALALAALAPHLTEVLLDDALQIACAFQEESNQANVLAALAPHLTEVLLKDALQIACAIQEGDSRAKALVALSSRIPILLPQALQAVRATQAQDYYFGNYYIQGLANLVPYDPDILPEILEAIRKLRNANYNNIRALGSILEERGKNQVRIYVGLEILSPHIDETALPEVLEIAQTIQDSFALSATVKELAPYLADDLSAALKAAKAIEDELFRADAIAVLAPHLSGELLPKALKAAKTMERDDCREIVLTALSPYLPSKLLPKALKIARAIQDTTRRLLTLATLASYIPEIASEILEEIEAIQGIYYRDVVLSKLSPHLSETLLPKAFKVAQFIQSEYTSANALIELVYYQPQFLSEAIKTIQGIQDKDFRIHGQLVSLIRKTAPRLSKEQIFQTFWIIKEIDTKDDGRDIMDTLKDIAFYLPEILLPEALKIARSIKSDYHRGIALASLTPRIPGILPETLQTIHLATNPIAKSDALAILAQYMPEFLLEALRAERGAISYSRYYNFLLLSPYFTQELLPEALKTACSYVRLEYRKPSLEALVPYLLKFSPISYILWKEFLRIRVKRERQYLAADIQVFIPVIAALGGKDAIRQLALAIEDVGRWFP